MKKKPYLHTNCAFLVWFPFRIKIKINFLLWHSLKLALLLHVFLLFEVEVVADQQQFQNLDDHWNFHVFIAMLWIIQNANIKLHVVVNLYPRPLCRQGNLLFITPKYTLHRIPCSYLHFIIVFFRSC